MSCDMTKLEYLNETKVKIKETIEANGREVAEGTPFREYPNLINEISGSKPTQSIIIGNGINAEIPLGVAEWVSDNLWNYWQDDNTVAKQSLTVTATPTAHCYLLACVRFKSQNLTLSGDGWSEIATSRAELSTDNYQYLKVFGKPVNAGSLEVTATQETENGINLKLIALYKCNSVSVVETNVINGYPYTPTAAAGKRRLYLTSNIYAGTRDDYFAVTADGLDLRVASTIRLHAYYDYQPKLGITPTFNYGLSGTPVLNTDSIIVLDILEEE